MATKSSKQTEQKAATAKGSKSKSKTAQRESADTAEVKTKAAKRSTAAAADTKTKSKAEAGTSRRQAQDGKAKSAKQKPAEVHGSSKKPTRPKPSSARASRKREPERNGRVAERTDRPAGLEGQAQEQGTRAAARAGQEQPETGQPQGRVASRLHQSMESHATAHGLGRVVGETQFDWGEIDNQDLRPDLAFVSFDRWAQYRNVPKNLTWHVVPDLVVEIVRGAERSEALGSRLNDYFKAGVSRVWVVDPRKVRVLDYHSPSEFQTLKRDQSIDGGTLLPGFRLLVGELAEKE
jgi:Uma2 family endonuclease